MDLKSRIERSNCLIMCKQSNVSLSEKNPVMKKISYKKMHILFDFSFLPLIENHLFSCVQIIIFFEEFEIRIFFFFKALYLN